LSEALKTTNEERQVLDQAQLRRALIRIAHEILESNPGNTGVNLVGIHTRGVPLAERIAGFIEEIGGRAPSIGQLDIGLYRDDLSRRGRPLMHQTIIPVPLEHQTVILVDDVLFTGRTVRAAMDALNDFGRPRQIRLAVLIDRGHRELPITANYVGKNIPSSLEEQVNVRLEESDGIDQVVLADKGNR